MPEKQEEPKEGAKYLEKLEEGVIFLENPEQGVRYPEKLEEGVKYLDEGAARAVCVCIFSSQPGPSAARRSCFSSTIGMPVMMSMLSAICGVGAQQSRCV
jgi:hypothetical protein